MDRLDRDQLFRELDDIKTIQGETRDLMRAQNGRVRSLEGQVSVIWVVVVAAGATALALAPIILQYYLGR